MNTLSVFSYNIYRWLKYKYISVIHDQCHARRERKRKKETERELEGERWNVIIPLSFSFSFFFFGFAISGCMRKKKTVVAQWHGCGVIFVCAFMLRSFSLDSLYRVGTTTTHKNSLSLFPFNWILFDC